ncbi:ATP-dependent protease ATPase subunit HslU [Alkalicoccus daliensis]|uniref:ATP-dependent protease ATPase subunit HslU n=1 Tax=Alkalicoccus daliensis TaxID=745820 RepID=A0A1H0A1Y5_9BACI|nr:ATP-dependent protease ATPase subunit HslU [Alkalicoccus daliensis]SDN27729.1 ATP-dependent HslUV protease ATP-binding subunit HslU [Alkalicoccus daliensis]
MSSSLTPAQIVDRLDQTIVGQKQAKRSVAVALRNRYRRSRLDDSLKEEITPKNILMIGPTGVGKTEIARRLAKLVGAPFIKVEATKFTEVGYVGRDVESMIRDLVETSVRLVQEEKKNRVKDKAAKLAEQRLVELLHPKKKKSKNSNNNYRNPLEMFFQEQAEEEEESEVENNAQDESYREARKRIQEKLNSGEMEDETVTLTVEEQGKNFMDMFQGGGMDQMGMNMQDMFGSMMPKQKKERSLPVKEARKVLTEQEAEKLINMEEVTQEAIDRAEQLGIIFIDEIDKVAGKSQQSADVSREGVQRDILPIIEGSTVVTKHGAVKTDHMLFIGAGAFHFSKPSDLIPELQGRLPIRVELDSLGVEDFVNILTQPKYALLKQYEAMLGVEGIQLNFEPEAVRKIAEIAAEVNDNTENIGARRLHTIMERLLEDLSFEATEITMETVAITANYVEEKLADVAKNRDVSQYIL